jgi:predicted O-methyltransferase YrrM
MGLGLEIEIIIYNNRLSRGKVAKAFKAISLIIRRPVLLNRVLSEPDIWEEYVISKYKLPEGLPVVSLDNITGSDEFSIEPVTFLDGGSLPTDLALLKGLASGIKECSYFEIGTWRGESVACVSGSAKECYTLCLTDEEMERRGVNKKAIEMHGMFSDALRNVIQLRGDSRSFDFTSPGRKFDLIFIDGDHHYDYVLQDTKNVIKYLVHENSTVVWHDYGNTPEDVRFEVLAAILDGTSRELHSKIFHVRHTKCAVMINRIVESKKAAFPVVPESYFEVLLKKKNKA